MPQKKIALINDITGFGRCSIAVMAPVVSAMKIQAVAVPTAILSTHTQFPEYYFDDYTPKMRDYIQTYKNLDMSFDAIATGFLGSEEQVDIVIDFIRTFKKPVRPTAINATPPMGIGWRMKPMIVATKIANMCHALASTPAGIGQNHRAIPTMTVNMPF